MTTAFTAFLSSILTATIIKPLTNLSRRILRSELSKLTQRVQMAECDEIDLNRRIKELTDENSRLARAGLQLVTDNKELERKLARETAAAIHFGRDRYKLIDENKSLTSEIGRLTQALSDSGNENRTLLAQLDETKTKLDAALLEAYGLQSQRRKDIDTINRMEQDITKLTQAFSDLRTDRDRLSRCIKDITETLELHQSITDADRAHAEKSISGMKRV